MPYYAHSGRDPGKADWQKLAEHLHSVAKLAGIFGQRLGIGRAAFIAGLVHDLGKYTVDFQLRLEGNDISVDHSTAGAQVLFGRAAGLDKVVAHVIAYAILGHHAGLPDRLNDTEGCYDERMKRRLPPLDPVWEAELGANLTGFAPDMIHRFGGDVESRAFSWAFMGRMIFSCLVDADFKDTEAFYVSLGEVEADRDWQSLQSLIGELTGRFDSYMAGLAGKGGSLDGLRRDILAHVRGKASEAPGLLTLTVPTGGGKTLASLGFALDHARQHGLERIIFAIPFAEAWIETCAANRTIRPTKVASRAEAWIET